MMNARLLKNAFFALSSLCVVSIAGCDAQDDEEQVVTERNRGGSTKGCHNAGKWLPKSSGKGSWSITPDPINGDGSGPRPGWPLSEIEVGLAKDSIVSALVSRFNDTEEIAACESVCADLGQNWTGEACALDASVEVGEAYVQETRSGLSRNVDVSADVAVGCACDGKAG